MLQVMQLPKLFRKHQTKQSLKELPEQLLVELRKQRAEQQRIEVDIEVEIDIEMERKTRVTMQAKTQLSILVPELLRMLLWMLRDTQLRLRFARQWSPLDRGHRRFPLTPG